MSDAPCYAVFSEFSPTLKPMRPGMNTRVFNHVDAHSPDSAIDLDESTGIITLAPGTYHITGFSTTIYYTGEEPAGMVEPRSPANGGYCRLRRADEDAEDRNAGFVFGSVCTANGLPSLVETYFTTAEEARIVMEHQCGSDVEDIYLQVYSDGSSKHVFARLSIRRL